MFYPRSDAFTYSVIIVSVLIALAVLSAVVAYGTEDTVTVTITDKERVVNQNSSRYLVYTETRNGNIEVFKNTDNLWYFKFNSSDVQAKLKPGEEYNLRVYGYRIPYTSTYRNIIDVDEL